MDQHIAESGVDNPVTADHINSKRYFIKEIKPEDDEGRIGDVCFVISEEKIVPPEPKTRPGMVLIPHSQYTISATDGTATKKGQGQVEFTGVTSLSLDGVFSADFDNYVISLRAVSTLGDFACNMRWRASGTDASGSNYTFQVIEANGTSVSASRSSSQSSTQLAKISDPLRSGYNTQVYGPFLAQPTAHRTVTSSANGNAVIYDVAGTHSLSTSYDGFTLTMAGGTMAGALQVYGVRS